MKKVVNKLLCSTVKFLAVLFSTVFFSAQASAVEFFVGLDGAGTKVEIADVTYNPILAKLRLGAFFQPGIGLELNFSDTYEVDEVEGLEIGLESHYAAMLRLQSPSEGVLSAYVNLGYGVTELSTANLGGGSQQVEELESPFFSVGFQKPLNTFPSFSYFGEYSRLYDDDDIKISALSIGFQFNM
jgi:hypothetical protein